MMEIKAEIERMAETEREQEEESNTGEAFSSLYPMFSSTAIA